MSDMSEATSDGFFRIHFKVRTCESARLAVKRLVADVATVRGLKFRGKAPTQEAILAALYKSLASDARSDPKGLAEKLRPFLVELEQEEEREKHEASPSAPQGESLLIEPGEAVVNRPVGRRGNGKRSGRAG